MHLSLRWGGGGCHGDMSTKSRSNIFDKAVIGCPVAGSRGRAKVKGQMSDIFIDRNKGWVMGGDVTL